jgi:glycosyltransferase involved in cell wall biosynthesis
MKFSVIIPHYKTGKMTAYCLSQLLKLKGKHDLSIIVIDNNPMDGSSDYLIPFLPYIEFYNYPNEKLQSHGVAFDWAMQFVETEYFLTLESDSYPTVNNWLNYYEVLISCGYEVAGSVLKLSGGEYMHPAGAMYKKSIWEEAKIYCDNIEYSYFPNIAMKEDFQCHGMIHNRIMDEFIKKPEKFVTLSPSYDNHTPLSMTERLEHYSSIRGPFHNGMGNLQESIKTYGRRNFESDAREVLLNNNDDIIHRIGYEPGQWLSYYVLATGRKLYGIPTRIQWLDKREYQQQEYTIMENGLRHEWGISAYYKGNHPNVQDIIDFKMNRMEELYNSLPIEQKIPS